MQDIKVKNNLIIGGMLLGVFLIGSIMLNNAIGNGDEDCHPAFPDFPQINSTICFTESGDVANVIKDWDDNLAEGELSGWAYIQADLVNDNNIALGALQCAGGFYPADELNQQLYIWASALSYVVDNNEGTAEVEVILNGRPLLGGVPIDVGGDNLGAGV
ncbi:hypothetical protein C6501_05855 [Candidatus Poribacteria bacterium]|nr:MAG: hypothetical protein C6501_05855 [Candidatus Poribacteria bacterium]